MSKQNQEVVITGLGPVTSIGVGADALWSSLSSGRAAVTRRTLPADLGLEVELPIAAMPPVDQMPELDPYMAFLAEQECAGSRDLMYALLAVELALTDARFAYDRDANNVGVVQVFEAPGVESTVSRLFGMMAGPLPTDGPPRVYDALAPSFYNMQPFVYVHLVGKALGLHGFSTSVHNACASGAFALEIAAQLIRTGQADAMIVVGGEAFETAVRLEWFRRLELYALEAQMRPFDEEPLGFYVGEGAGAILLESASSAEKRAAQPYAVYRAGCFAHQGWKQTIPDVRSARLREVTATAMNRAGIKPEDVEFVVPHGAATALSDKYEATCLEEALGGRASGAVATVFKPYVGHMLAASGVIETICALQALRHQKVPPTLHTRAAHTRFPVPLASATSDHAIHNLVKLSTGFTGHDAASVFARP